MSRVSIVKPARPLTWRLVLGDARGVMALRDWVAACLAAFNNWERGASRFGTVCSPVLIVCGCWVGSRRSPRRFAYLRVAVCEGCDGVVVQQGRALSVVEFGCGAGAAVDLELGAR